jgi:hypothetical protein
MLDYRLLAACISIILGSLLYFFYWNRFIAFLLSIVFRISFWQQGSSSVWLEIGDHFRYDCCHRNDVDHRFRLYPFRPTGRSHPTQGCPVSLQQPNSKDSEGANPMEVLDTQTHN